MPNPLARADDVGRDAPVMPSKPSIAQTIQPAKTPVPIREPDSQDRGECRDKYGVPVMIDYVVISGVYARLVWLETGQQAAQ